MLADTKPDVLAMMGTYLDEVALLDGRGWQVHRCAGRLGYDDLTRQWELLDGALS